MFDPIVFGEKLRNHRKSKNMTQEEVAVKLKVSGQAVSKWENGECLPDSYNLKQLGDVYGVSLDILLETGNLSESTSVVEKIKQLATEYIWSKMKNNERENAHKELGDDLWEMWKAIYFVEIGNKRLQEREMKYAKNRISGKYGTKVWDENGVACAIRSKLKEKLTPERDAGLKVIQTLLSDQFYSVIKHLDCHDLIKKQDLVEKSGLDEVMLNEILIYLTENKVIEYAVSHDQKLEGYKLIVNRGIIVYMLLASVYLFSENNSSTSEYRLF